MAQTVLQGLDRRDSTAHVGQIGVQSPPSLSIGQQVMGQQPGLGVEGPALLAVCEIAGPFGQQILNRQPAGLIQRMDASRVEAAHLDPFRVVHLGGHEKLGEAFHKPSRIEAGKVLIHEVVGVFVEQQVVPAAPIHHGVDVRFRGRIEAGGLGLRHSGEDFGQVTARVQQIHRQLAHAL